jgi:hypothetical protein
MAAGFCGVYDFELLPYALGDVLTWNVQTSLRCEAGGRDHVDVFVCVDRRNPSSIYQRNLVTGENCGLFFSELFGAFGTHPRLGSIFVFHERERLLAELRRIAPGDALNEEVLADYERVLVRREDEGALNEYFIKYIYTHDEINRFAKAHGRIPLLHASAGCEPDTAGLIETLFAGKRIVVIHPRLRRLDQGYGGAHTNWRDSDFLEWYEFLRAAERRHPDVAFVVVGRLQEKPLEILKLPNVVSLRTLGLGLGHELSLMLQSNLFIGTSSGFAAMANFSETPYFITKVNEESCNAYGIPPGCERLPFARPDQILVYEPETTDLLLRLLERGLAGSVAKVSGPAAQRMDQIDPPGFARERARWLHSGATTSRFFTDDAYSRQEAAFLLLPRIKEAEADCTQSRSRAVATASRIEANFPQLRDRFPDLVRLKNMLDQGADREVSIARAPRSLRARIVGCLPGPVRRLLRASRSAFRRLRRVMRHDRLARGH